LSRHPLLTEITAVLLFKAVVLAGLYLAFFAPSDRPRVTPERLGAALVQAGPGAAGGAVSHGHD
jgi:hypothetical protein